MRNGHAKSSRSSFLLLVFHYFCKEAEKGLVLVLFRDRFLLIRTVRAQKNRYVTLIVRLAQRIED